MVLAQFWSRATSGPSAGSMVDLSPLLAENHFWSFVHLWPRAISGLSPFCIRGLLLGLVDQLVSPSSYLVSLYSSPSVLCLMS